MTLRPVEATAPLVQRFVELRFARERRRVAANGGHALPVSRRRLVSLTRRYLRRARRWEATRALSGHPAAFEGKRFSQNGEDGIIAAILERIGMTGGTFVEIGAADGHENCTRALAETRRWRGVWIEADADRAAQAAALTEGVEVRTVTAFVDRDNVAGLVGGALGDRGLDMLVIDVDGNDWHLWRALGRHHRPALVVTEVNGALGPWVDWVMPYDPAHRWREDRYHGATLRALARLARTLGYVLVACDGNGVNAFWVRDDLAAGFPAAGRVRSQYAPPAHSPPGGHPWCPVEAFDAVPLSADELGVIRLERAKLVAARERGRVNAVVVDVVNGSGHPIASGGGNPVRVTARWGADPAASVWTEPTRGVLTGVVAPGALGTGVVVLPVQTADFATVDLVQDGVGWAHDAPGWEPVRVGVV